MHTRRQGSLCTTHTSTIMKVILVIITVQIISPSEECSSFISISERRKAEAVPLPYAPSTPTMASRATPLIPPDHPHHRSTKGPVIFTGVGLTGTSIIIFIIVFCKYRVRARAPVTTGAGAAVSNQEERRPVGVDIAKLPEAFSFTESARWSGGGDEAQCSVCLGTVQVGETVRRLPLCKHLYHVECIDMWLASHTTCPLCRADVEPPGKNDYQAASPEPEQTLPV